MPYPIGQDNMPLEFMHKFMEGDAGDGNGGGQNSDDTPGDGHPSDLGWRMELPEDMREDPNVAKFDSVEALAKSYIHASSMIGRDKIPMPKTDDEWNEVYSKLGRPEKAEEYELALSDSLPQDLKDEIQNSTSWFKDTAHKLGLSRKQASQFFESYTDRLKMQTKENETLIADQMKTTQETLRSEYGEAYDAKLHLANRAIDRFGGADLVEILRSSGLGRNPSVVRAFVKVGELIAEDLGLDKNGQPANTPQELEDEIQELQAKPEYLDDTHPNHKNVVRRVQTLMSRLYPE